MFQNIQFRDCAHRNVAGPTEAAVVAAVRGDHCLPAAAPVEAASLFYGVAQVLGGTAFKSIWSAFQRSASRINPLDFADFLATQEPGRAFPALADLARFDLAFGLAAQPGPTPSIAACCLPEALLRAHPEMMLRFQPGWRYLRLDWPVQELLTAPATADSLRALQGPQPHFLLIAPGGMGVDIRVLSPAEFALQAALRNGERLSQAIAAAQALEPALDPYPIVNRLVEAGAIIDVVLHPAPMPSLANPDI